MAGKGTVGLIMGFSMVVLFAAFTGIAPVQTPEPWKAPGAADSIKSAVVFNAKTAEKGEELYNLYCLSCHGETGMGDGPASASLVIKPANFHLERVIKQTNGALYWKLTNGRGSMPAMKEVLKDEERWQLVSFIRKMQG